MIDYLWDNLLWLTLGVGGIGSLGLAGIYFWPSHPGRWRQLILDRLPFCSTVPVLGMVLMSLFIYMVAEHEHRLEILAWKVIVAMAGGLVGWLADIVLFSKHGSLDDQESDIAKAAVLLRRGIVVSLGMMACAIAI